MQCEEREEICFYGDKEFLNPHWCSPPFPRWRGRWWGGACGDARRGRMWVLLKEHCTW